MAGRKGKIKEILKSGEAPGVMGSKKKYLIDHKTVWDPAKKKALVTASEFATVNGKRRGIIETSNKIMQRKLEKMGYSPDGENKLMHEKKAAPFNSIKSEEQVRRENALV